MVCAVLVVVDFLIGLAAALVSVTALLALVGVTWYLLPLKRGRDPRVQRTE